MDTEAAGRERLQSSRKWASEHRDVEVNTDVAQTVCMNISYAFEGIAVPADAKFGLMLWSAHFFWNMATTREEAHALLKEFAELTAAHIDMLYDNEAGVAKVEH